MERRGFLKACGAVATGGLAAVRALFAQEPKHLVVADESHAIRTWPEPGPDYGYVAAEGIGIETEIAPLRNFTHLACRAGEDLEAGQAVVIRGFRAFAARAGDRAEGIVESSVRARGFADVCVRGVTEIHFAPPTEKV